MFSFPQTIVLSAQSGVPGSLDWPGIGSGLGWMLIAILAITSLPILRAYVGGVALRAISRGAADLSEETQREAA